MTLESNLMHKQSTGHWVTDIDYRRNQNTLGNIAAKR